MSKENPTGIKIGPIFLWSGACAAVSFVLVSRQDLSLVGFGGLCALVLSLLVFGMNYGLTTMMVDMRSDYIITPRKYIPGERGAIVEKFASEWNDYDPEAGE